MNNFEIQEIIRNHRLIEEGIWIPKNIPNIYDDISYPKDGNVDCFNIEERSFWFKHRNNCLVEVFKRFPPEGTLYDIGGGNGYVSLGLKSSGFDTILIEPSIEGARNARSRGLNPVICATLEGAGFKENTIPAIGLFDVLEHIKDDIGYLRKIKSFLVKSGRLYVTVPAFKLLWSSEDNLANHYRRYTLKGLMKKTESSGYKIDYATYFFSILPLPIFLFRSIPTKLGLRKDNAFKQVKKEHNPKRGILGYLVNRCLEKELCKIKTHKINFGSSCLIVARSKR